MNELPLCQSRNRCFGFRRRWLGLPFLSKDTWLLFLSLLVSPFLVGFAWFSKGEPVTALSLIGITAVILTLPRVADRLYTLSSNPEADRSAGIGSDD